MITRKTTNPSFILGNESTEQEDKKSANVTETHYSIPVQKSDSLEKDTTFPQEFSLGPQDIKDYETRIRVREGIALLGESRFHPIQKMLGHVGNIGLAYAEGDCFFDSIAQGLKEAKISIPVESIDEDYKKLRMLCQQFALHEPDFCKSTLEEDYQQYILNIQWTAEEITQEYKKKHTTQSTPTWGRQNVEGIFICKQLNIKLHVIELHEVEGSIVFSHQLIDSSSAKIVAEDDIDYEDHRLIHIVGYKLHFVPYTPHLLKRRLELKQDKIGTEKNHSNPLLSTISSSSTRQFLYREYNSLFEAKDYFSTRNLLRYFSSPPGTKSKIKSQVDENSALLPKSQSLPDFRTVSNRSGYGTLHQTLLERGMKKGYAKVYIWDKNIGSDGSTKRPTGHVSMRLFTADEKEIPWREGGYISVYPIEECNLEIRSGMPSTPRPNSYWLIKESQKKWRLLYINQHGTEAEININRVPYLITTLPNKQKPDDLSKEEKLALYKVIRGYKNKVLPWQEIVCLHDMAEDKTAEGGLPDKEFKVRNIDIAAIRNHFKEYIQNGKMKWSVRGSGCFRSHNNTNCAEVVLNLLIVHGKLNTDIYNHNPLFRHEMQQRGKPLYKTEFEEANATLEAIEGNHNCIKPTIKIGLYAVLLVAGIIIAKITISMIIAALHDPEEAGTLIVGSGGGSSLVEMLGAVSLTLLSTGTIGCYFTLKTHAAISPSDVGSLLKHLSRSRHFDIALRNTKEKDKNVELIYERGGLNSIPVNTLENQFQQELDEKKPGTIPIHSLEYYEKLIDEEKELYNIIGKDEYEKLTEIEQKSYKMVSEEKIIQVEESTFQAIQAGLRSGISPDVENENGCTLLHGAVAYNRSDIIEILLEHKADINKATNCELGVTPLHIAVSFHNELAVQNLLEKKATVDKESSDGSTPLFFAAKAGKCSTVKLLLENKANMDHINKEGHSPRTVAEISGHQEIINIFDQWQSKSNRR